MKEEDLEMELDNCCCCYTVAVHPYDAILL